MPGLAVQAWGPLEGVVGDTCVVRHVGDTRPVEKLADQWGDRIGGGRRFSESASHSEVLSEEKTEMVERCCRNNYRSNDCGDIIIITIIFIYDRNEKG